MSALHGFLVIAFVNISYPPVNQSAGNVYLRSHMIAELFFSRDILRSYPSIAIEMNSPINTGAVK